MDKNGAEGRRNFLRFLHDPDDLRLSTLKYPEHRKKRSENGRRKYSAEMRQKATIREKNRIRAIGKEFNKLAELLPQANGGKRSHQKILQDTVAYIRALEVELNLTDEKSLFESWSVDSENTSGVLGNYEGEPERRKGLHNRELNDSKYNLELLRVSGIYGATTFSGLLQGELAFESQIFTCCGETENFCVCHNQRKATETRSSPNNTATFYNGLKMEERSPELSSEDQSSVYSETDLEYDCLQKEGQEYEDGEPEIKVFDRKHSLSFDNVVTGLQFKL